MMILERLVRWAFPSMYRTLFESLHEIRKDQAVLLAGMRRIESQPPRVSRRVYVTLRGTYKLPHREAPVPHGWTQAVDIDDGDMCSMVFEPYNMFETERIDVLGPAVILGALVANQAQESPKFESPATFEFKARIDVGNRITVRLKGTP